MIHLHIPKQKEFLPPILANIKQFQLVVQVLQEKLVAQQQYQHKLKILKQKLLAINIPKHNFQCQNVDQLPMLMASLISEKVHQINTFGTNMKLQIKTIKDLFMNQNNSASQHYSKIKQIENIVRQSYEKLVRFTQKMQIQFKETDEKLICNQISMLNPSNINASDPELSMKIMQNQDQLKTKYEKILKNLKKTIKASNKQFKEEATGYFQQHQKVCRSFTDFVKKYIIQDLSLIRNFQYDIDTFIKKSGLFDISQVGQQNINSVQREQKQQLISQKKNQLKIPKIFLKQAENQQLLKLSIADFIKQIVEKKGELKVPELSMNKKQLLQYPMDSILHDQKKFKNIMQQIKTNFSEKKNQILSSIQCFRLKNQLKFQEKLPFIQICLIFEEILKVSIINKDIYSIRFLLIHATSYYFSVPDENKDITIFDIIETSQPIMKQPNFWKAYLYLIIRQSLRQSSQSLSVKGQMGSQVFHMHCDNAVYSTLISNSKLVMNSIQDKYFAKNLLAKSAKSYGLSEQKVVQMLKFIENSYEKSSKSKEKIMVQIEKIRAQIQKLKELS